MEKCYLIVVCVENQNYIQLAESDGKYTLRAYHTKEEALKEFESFKEKALSSNYETHISGSIGIINLRPHVIGVDKNDPKSLAEYVIDESPYVLKGSTFGAFIDMAGVKVKEEILTLSVCDVAKDCIDAVYSR